MPNIDKSKLITKAMTVAAQQALLREAVTVERDRRIYGGFTFNGVVYQSDDRSRSIIDQTSTLADKAISAGAEPGDLRWASPDEDFFWIAADNSLNLMDAQTVVELNKAAIVQRTLLIKAGTLIKAMDQIPEDFTADKYWQ